MDWNWERFKQWFRFFYGSVHCGWTHICSVSISMECCTERHVDTCLMVSDLTYLYRPTYSLSSIALPQSPSYSVLLPCPLNTRYKPHPIFNINLDIHTPPKTVLPIIQRSCLNSSDVRHYVGLAVETRAAVRTEEVAVILARVPGCVAVFG